MKHSLCSVTAVLRPGAVLVALLVLGACGSASPAGPTPAPSGTVSLLGTVTSQDGVRLAGATIRIADGANAGRSTTSGVAGEYRFDELAAGSGSLIASADGYDPIAISVRLDGRTPLDFTLRSSEPWTISGIGDAVFSMPAYITRVHITGEFTGRMSFFTVHVGECAIVDDRLGTAPGLIRTRSDGTYLVTPAGNPPPNKSDRKVEILDSTGVSWSITEDRTSNGGTPCYLY